jgi:hypothetical protein
MRQKISGRKTPLSLGEWLWLSPSAFYAAPSAIALCLPRGTIVPFPLVLLLLIAQGLCSLFAFYYIAAMLVGWVPKPALRWTTVCGALVALLAGPVGAYVINEALSQL